ncbi:MAG: tRNA (N6-isopentenyl adenosine(37)-C2)-methylthiotransferase MiaB [bacterium]
MPSVFIKTYGCQMNERDSEQVARDLQDRGHKLVSSEREADVILLNTCSVREMAERKAIGKMGMLRKLRREKPKLVLGFMGCMAQRLGESLKENTPHIDLVVGTQKFHRVADYVEEALQKREQAFAREDILELGESINPPIIPIVDTAPEAGSQNTIRDHLPHDEKRLKKEATSFISIMQGCNMHCTFCIVPSTRGEERGRPIAEIVAEARILVERGIREVTLLGQIVNLYGRHEFPIIGGKSPFVQLIEALHDINGLDRIRFTSPHPMGFRKDLVDSFARLPKLMEHVHLPLQSGSDRILKAMHRPYTACSYRKLVNDLRASRPGISITTDIIVGFPGETEDDYKASRDLAEEIGFDGAFIFRYSQRGDTPAAEMKNQLSEEVKESRNQDLLSVVNASASRHLDACVGTRQEILCEGPSRNDPLRLAGRTRTNKIVIFEGGNRFHGEIFDVAITSASASTLYGDPAIHNGDPAGNDFSNES